ncbi:MAG: DNA mismatch repair protein MutS [Verrucomicrobiae bacterium]|nr:DNA mismatch repair protein MutS [Verrucomicrobiae bacterium]
MAENPTPMMQQYLRVKREIPPDALLLFRLGDFYELFMEDAKTASQILNLTLTQRNGTPMCGLPHHACDNYIARLIRAGRKVAICDQLEEAGQSKGIIKREVTQILSPGTVMADRFLESHQNNFIVSLFARGQTFGLALLDITTGDFRLTELPDHKALLAEMRRLSPAEILLPEGDATLTPLVETLGARISHAEAWVFEQETAYFTLRDHFKTQSLDGFGCKDLSIAIGAAGGLLHYLQNQLRRQLNHIQQLHVYRTGDFMALDTATRRNLELLEEQHTPGGKATLYRVLDRTVTPMGARLLRDWVSNPLRSVEKINARLEVIGELLRDSSFMAQLREKLGEVKDLERLIGRLASGGGNARDLLGLRLSLEALPDLRKLTTRLQTPLAVENHQRISIFPKLTDHIRRAIADEPPLALKEGGLIRDGYDPALDELKNAMRSGKDWIARLQQQEIDRTGIKSLKIRFNSVFGYYIEVTKTNLAQVPPEYIRKQTVATGERFITPELKEMENKILGAEERSVKLEYELFQRMREEAIHHTADIQETARGIAALDALASLAETAARQGYVKPEVNDDDVLDIVDGRHPVLESIMQTDPNHMGKGGFVPNDTRLDTAENQVILLTGPNMAGKSTYIRQVALLALMAQIGSFVPAKSAVVGVVDRIFTRVGAADDLARGQSTFMVEMNETANILNNATNRSLIILDEIGRGTSTYDGISIAWAVVEYLHEHIGAKTLFATHYHELTTMSRLFPRVKNCNVVVREWNDQIIFLRKVQPGGADKSYGIQVARLAGLPHEVLDRAKTMLNRLEASSELLDLHAQPGEAAATRPSAEKRPRAKKPVTPGNQLVLFAADEV